MKDLVIKFVKMQESKKVKCLLRIYDGNQCRNNIT